jgi:hypothetical protein
MCCVVSPLVVKVFITCLTFSTMLGVSFVGLTFLTYHTIECFYKIDFNYSNIRDKRFAFVRVEKHV